MTARIGAAAIFLVGMRRETSIVVVTEPTVTGSAGFAVFPFDAHASQIAEQEQATQELRKHHLQAAAALCSSLRVLEGHHGVEHDA